MAESSSAEIILRLEQKFRDQDLERPQCIRRYEPGAVLEYELRGVFPPAKAKARFEIEKFVGGGFAGQVYKARLLALEDRDGQIKGLTVGDSYALKIFIPAKGFGRRVRNFLYWMGFQAPFSLQVNPAAGRSQALWQKFIRRAALIEFGSEDAVVDVLATLIDSGLGSCAEVSQWVDGRLWRFEVDDDLDDRRVWKIGGPDEGLGSPEYRTKRAFMVRLVRLMHRMGALELARQYEWWSLKSQPNVLKRTSSDPDPRTGLVAVDFRAGMALTPVTPQCPIDIKLIFQGLGRGRLVQFDKGNVEILEAFVAEYPQEFADMRSALEELRREEEAYRESLIDFTYHHIRLFGGRLRHSIMNGFRDSWRVRNMTDARASAKLERSAFLSLVFLLLPFLPLATVALFVFAFPGPILWKYPLWLAPLLTPLVRKVWGRTDYRRHYRKMMTSLRYFLRAGRARIMEALIRWHRAGRISEAKALKISGGLWRYGLHLPLSILPPGLHRFLTDGSYFKQKLIFIFVRPLRLYFNAAAREQWLRDMIAQGNQNGMLTDMEASRIISQIKEPFIQKYLKSLAVHVCTLPVTQIVSVTLAIIYVKLHPELSWQQASVHVGLILGLFQVTPISPGSLVRGLYTTILVLRERNYRDYNIAFWMSFFKYVGYLAFPIQMAYRYPDLARFMAGHWATGAVHIVPVFGEKGAWLEHFVFDAFYNFPLTIRRRMQRRQEFRKALKPRYGHTPLVVVAGTALLALLDFAYFKVAGKAPALKDVWWLALWAPFFASALVSRMAGGVRLGRRIMLGLFGGGIMGFLYVLAKAFLPPLYTTVNSAARTLGQLTIKSVWHIFLFTLVAVIGAIVAETRK